jgi:hypothetical protein
MLKDFVTTKKIPTYNPDYILANYKDKNYVNTLYVEQQVSLPPQNIIECPSQL